MKMKEELPQAENSFKVRSFNFLRSVKSHDMPTTMARELPYALRIIALRNARNKRTSSLPFPEP